MDRKRLNSNLRLRKTMKERLHKRIDGTAIDEGDL